LLSVIHKKPTFVSIFFHWVLKELQSWITKEWRRLESQGGVINPYLHGNAHLGFIPPTISPPLSFTAPVKALGNWNFNETDLSPKLDPSRDVERRENSEHLVTTINRLNLVRQPVHPEYKNMRSRENNRILIFNWKSETLYFYINNLYLCRHF
jgi:hypothetical protein